MCVFVAMTRVPYVVLIKLFELLLVGMKLWRRCIYPTHGRVSAYILILMLTYPQPPLWLTLVRCRATPGNIVPSASCFAWQMYPVKICVRGGS